MSTVYTNSLVLKGEPSVEITSQTLPSSNVSVLRSIQSRVFSTDESKVLDFSPATSSSLSPWVVFNHMSNNFTFKGGMHVINAQIHVTKPLCTGSEYVTSIVGGGSGAFANAIVTDNSSDIRKVPSLISSPDHSFEPRALIIYAQPIWLELRAMSGGNIIGQSSSCLMPTIDSVSSGRIPSIEPVAFNMILNVGSDTVVTFELNVSNKDSETNPLRINDLSNTSLMYVNSFSS